MNSPHLLSRIFRPVLLAAAISSVIEWTAAVGRAEVPADQAAEMLLNSARKAYNEQNLPFAAARFQEFLQKFSGHPQAASARYGLALCFLESPEPSFEKAIEQLAPIAGNAALPDHAYVVYYLGLANRGLALNDFSIAVTKQGDEQKQLRGRAESRCHEAAKHFATASNAFMAKVPKEKAVAEPPRELEWAARARCDQAEMELRGGKWKEARATAEPFTNDAQWKKSLYRPLGLYYYGFAAFLLQDYLVAGRTLNQLSPFADPVFGLHARYLMGRIYQISEEPDKALVMYEGVLADFERQKKEAIEALKRPEQFKTNPSERIRLEKLTKGAEHITGASFFCACLLYDAGKFAEALGKFQSFAKEYAGTPYEREATLRIGCCQVHLKQYPEAVATLTPLAEKNSKLADQALLWIGKAQAGAAFAAEPGAARDNQLKAAIGTMKTASERAAQLVAMDPDAKRRRAEIVLEMADTHQHARQFKEAAALLEQLRNEKVLPTREEEMTERLITAHHLAGDTTRSDQLAVAFQRDFPRSTLMPLVLFRAAENAYFAGLAVESKPDASARTAELAKLYEEAARRYRLLLERYPEFERIQLARYGLAMCHFKRNELEDAQKVLEAIPAAERNGDLSHVPYLLAECLIRFAPAKAEDALQIGMLQEKLQQAQQNLEAFIAANPKAAEAPDAMLKLGVCQTRLAVLNAQPQERNNSLAAARKTFEVLIQLFPAEPQGIQAVFERAKCIGLMGDKGNAINELRRFTIDPLQQNPIAAIAAVHLATLLREQNKAEEAATIVNNARQRHEGGLLKDNPERAALLRYHHGVCLQEAGKFAEARAHLETIPALAPGKSIAVEAILRTGQCRLAAGRKSIEMLRQQLGAPNLKPEQRADLENQIQHQFNGLDEAAAWMQGKAEEARESQPVLEARVRIYYDAAWAWRSIAEREVAAARGKLQQARHKALQAEADKKAAKGTKAADVPSPEIPLRDVPVQPAQAKARNAYQLLIGYGFDTMLAIEARFELAEMLAEREEHDAAINLLKEALDKEPSDNKAPSAEFLDKVRVRLGDCLAAKKDFAGALDKLVAVADNPKSPLAAEAQYRAGECLLELNEADKAVTRLVLFRDKPEYRNIGGVSDRALLRLGHAFAATKQWELSRQALDLFGQRYQGSPWINEARYGLGWAHQNLGQFDQAVNAYKLVIANTTNELAARAHLQTGLCRLEQKRFGEAATALQIVPFTFDYPELSAAALTEAARALIDDKKPEEAERLLLRVIKEYPGSNWAGIARKRMDELKK